MLPIMVCPLLHMHDLNVHRQTFHHQMQFVPQALHQHAGVSFDLVKAVILQIKPMVMRLELSVNPIKSPIVRIEPLIDSVKTPVVRIESFIDPVKSLVMRFQATIHTIKPLIYLVEALIYLFKAPIEPLLQ
jgi:hypothetical protein